MTSIVANMQNNIPSASTINTAAPVAQSVPQQTQGMPQGHPQAQLNPQFTSLLTTGGMAALLGALWASPKIQGAGELLNLSDKKYEAAVKKIKNSTDTSVKTSIDAFDTFRKNIPSAAEKSLNEYFNGKDTITLESLLKGRTKEPTKEALQEQINLAKTSLVKKLEAETILEDLKKSGKITKAIEKKINQLYPQDEIATNKYLADFKKALAKQFANADKKKIEEKFIDFMTKQAMLSEQEINNLTKIQRLANCAENGKITKGAAEKVMKDFAFEDILDPAKRSFENFKDKLPKARIKGAFKWLGLGIVISIITRMVFGLFAGRKEKH